MLLRAFGMCRLEVWDHDHRETQPERRDKVAHFLCNPNNNKEFLSDNLPAEYSV